MTYIYDTIKSKEFKSLKKYLIYPGGYFKGKYSGHGRRPEGVEHEVLHPDKIYGFDLDGTIANIQHRVGHIVPPYITGKKDYKLFFKQCIADTLNHDVAGLMRLLPKESVYIFSGRNGMVLEETVQWLNRWNVPYARLYMRYEKNYEKDTILKARMVEDIKDRIRFMVDDRQSVVDMWRSMGITTFQVNQWDEYEPTDK